MAPFLQMQSQQCQAATSLVLSLLPPSSIYVCPCSVAQLVASWTVAHQAPLSVDFSRQEYWSGLLFPPTGDLPNPRIKPSSLVSPALADGHWCQLEKPSGDKGETTIRKAFQRKLPDLNRKLSSWIPGCREQNRNRINLMSFIT